MFTGFPEETLQFFIDLRFNNNKMYFEENRARYEEVVKAPFHAFIEELAPYMLKIDPQMEVRPYKCLARIHRDTRFSKDKSPYRDHLWLCFRRAAEPREGSVNFFFELTPRDVSWGFGTWGENKPLNEVLRRRIEADPKGMEGIIRSVDFAGHDLGFYGNTYKRMALPANVPDTMRPWYTLRDMYIGKTHTKLEWALESDIVQRVVKDFQELAPLYKMMRGCYNESQLSE